MIITYLKLLIGFFANMVINLKIILSENFETTIEYETENPVHNAINKLKNHLSTKMIIFKLDPNKRFSFCPVPHHEILKQTKNLDTKKGNTAKRHPNKIVKAKLLLLFKFLP